MTKIICETLTARTIQVSFDQQMPCEILEQDGRCQVRHLIQKELQLEQVLILVGVTNSLCTPKMVYGSASKTFPNISANRNHSIYEVSFPKSALFRFHSKETITDKNSVSLKHKHTMLKLLKTYGKKKSQQQPLRSNHWSLVSRGLRTALVS